MDGGWVESEWTCVDGGWVDVGGWMAGGYVWMVGGWTVSRRVRMVGADGGWMCVDGGGGWRVSGRVWMWVDKWVVRGSLLYMRCCTALCSVASRHPWGRNKCLSSEA